MINIKGMNKAAVLAALYNAARTQGMGYLAYRPSHSMTVTEAQALLNHSVYFDYIEGRVLKVDLSSDDSFDERLYDRDNGQGAALLALSVVPSLS